MYSRPIHTIFIKVRSGEIKKWKSPSRVEGRSPGRGSAEAEAFFVKLHIIFALKYHIQQLLLLLDKSTSKIVEGHLTMDVPLHKYWGDMSPLSHTDRRPW